MRTQDNHLQHATHSVFASPDMKLWSYIDIFGFFGHFFFCTCLSLQMGFLKMGSCFDTIARKLVQCLAAICVIYEERGMSRGVSLWYTCKVLLLAQDGTSLSPELGRIRNTDWPWPNPNCRRADGRELEGNL